MNCIVNCDKNWAIGNKGKLLVHIPNDMKYFKRLTVGKVVVLGRKTLETFPQGSPLPERTNIILTRDASYSVKGAVVVHSIDELMEKLKEYNSEDVFIIGGDSVYSQMISYCDTCYVTRVDYSYEADSYFPNLDKDPEWAITEESEEQTYFDLEYTFVKYERIES